MPAAILGNGKMLAALKENGELSRLFWPQIDYGQHLGYFWPGIKTSSPGEAASTKWLHLDLWNHSQRHLNNTNILQTKMQSRTHSLEVVQQDFVLPAKDILVRHYTLTNHGTQKEKLTFLVYCAFSPEESLRCDGVYVDFFNNSLVFYRRNVCLAIAAATYPLAGYQCGRRGTPADPFRNADSGILSGDVDNIRESAGSLAWDMGEMPPHTAKDFTLFLAAGASQEEVSTLLTSVLPQAGAALLAQTKHYWHHWLAEKEHTIATANSGNTGAESKVYNRSLLAMQLMTSKETGASIAAPEFDGGYLMCGGYGYCWPRDAVFSAAAFDEAGYHDTAAHFYKFAGSVQNKEGDWQQRYFTDGSVAPSWGKQTDQVGSVLWGYRHHYTLTQDNNFLEQIWPSLAAGAEYLARSLDSNGLPYPSFDLWEDEYGQSTYAAAAVYGGLTAASDLALLKKEEEAAQRWRLAAATVKEGILKHQWSDRQKSFTRGANRRVYKDMYEQEANAGQTHFKKTDPAGLYPSYWLGKDERLDAALLGLVFPFGVFTPKDEKMLATVKNIEERLWNNRVGGLHRYEGDSYRGGNPWLITTFWLAIYYCTYGDRRRAETLYQWCLDQANQHHLLPEQADKNNGGPAWVMPLNWSHAMHILTRLALDNKLSITP